MTRIGFKPILAAGMVLIAAGLLWFGQISPDGSFVSDILGPSLLAAVGLGFAFVPQTIAAVSGVAEREAGLASGLINTSQQIGGALGLARAVDGRLHADRRRRDRGGRCADAGDAHRRLRRRVHGRRRDRAARRARRR